MCFWNRIKIISHLLNFLYNIKPGYHYFWYTFLLQPKICRPVSWVDSWALKTRTLHFAEDRYLHVRKLNRQAERYKIWPRVPDYSHFNSDGTWGGGDAVPRDRPETRCWLPFCGCDSIPWQKPLTERELWWLRSLGTNPPWQEARGWESEALFASSGVQMQGVNTGAQLPSKQKPVRSLLGSSLFDWDLKENSTSRRIQNWNTGKYF